MGEPLFHESIYKKHSAEIESVLVVTTTGDVICWNERDSSLDVYYPQKKTYGNKQIQSVVMNSLFKVMTWLMEENKPIRIQCNCGATITNVRTFWDKYENTLYLCFVRLPNGEGIDLVYRDNQTGTTQFKPSNRGGEKYNGVIDSLSFIDTSYNDKLDK